MEYNAQNTRNIIVSFFKLYGIKYTNKYLDDLITRHPDQSSFWGIKDILCRYGIDCECVNFKNVSDISQDTTPFIAKKQGEMLIVYEIKDESAIIVTATGDKVVITLSSFLDTWDGNALIIDVENLPNEPNFSFHKNQRLIQTIRRVCFCCAVLFLIATVLATLPIQFAFTSITLLVIANIGGLIISVLLLCKSHRISHSIVDFLCQNDKATVDCNRVIHSNGATFFKLCDLSELCCSFFAVNSLFLLASSDFIHDIAIFISIAVPVTVWSIYYQNIRIKTWCPLCLSVSIIIWISAITIYVSQLYEHINIYSCLVLCASYLVMLEIAHKVGTMLDSHQTLVKISREYNYLKYNSSIFDFILNKSPRCDTHSITAGGLYFGNKDAKINITIISNPFCNPCAQMHKRLSEIKNSNVRFQYIFTNFSKEMESVNKYLIGFYNKYGEEPTWNVLDKWFSSEVKDISFFDFIDFDYNTEKIMTDIHKSREWLKSHPFMKTPTVLINGREVVWPYEIEDYTYYS